MKGGRGDDWTYRQSVPRSGGTGRELKGGRQMFTWIGLSILLIWGFYFWLLESMNGSGPKGAGHRRF
jgi:hypothetical protein